MHNVFFVIIATFKNNPAKNTKVIFLRSLTVCIGVVFRKSIGAIVEVSTNRLKLCTVYFVDFFLLKTILAEKLKVVEFISTLMYIYKFYA